MQAEQILIDLLEMLFNAVNKTIRKIHMDWERFSEEMKTYTALQSKVNIANEFTKEIAYTHFPKEYLANEAVKAFFDKTEIDYSIISLAETHLSEEPFNEDAKNKCLESSEKYKHQTIDKIEKLKEVLNDLDPDLSNKIVSALELNPKITHKELQHEIFGKPLEQGQKISDFFQESIFSYDAQTVQNLGFYNFFLANNSCAKHSLEVEFMKVMSMNTGVIDSLHISENLKCDLLNFKENIFDLTSEKIADMVNSKSLNDYIYQSYSNSNDEKTVKNNSYTEAATSLDINNLATIVTKEFCQNENNMNSTINELKAKMEEKVHNLDNNKDKGFDDDNEQDNSLDISL